MRAGLTGLGIVFLFTLAASLAFGPSSEQTLAAEQDKAPGEPLAQLGVAPGIEKDKDGTPSGPDVDTPITPQEAPAPESPPPAFESPAGGSQGTGPLVPGPLTPGLDQPVEI